MFTHLCFYNSISQMKWLNNFSCVKSFLHSSPVMTTLSQLNDVSNHSRETLLPAVT